ncbi:MAG: hypothetical protein U0787_21180 [Polyangia bacterium]
MIGAFGLARYLPHNIVGCDVTFAQKPLANLLAVRASALHLPFSDESFAAVVSSDAGTRSARSASAGDFGNAAGCAQGRRLWFSLWLAGAEARRRLPDFSPRTQHRSARVADRTHAVSVSQTSLFAQLEPAWRVRFFGNESLRFHALINHAERRGPWNRLFQTGLSLVPTLCERALQLFDRPPFYRQICIIERA